MGLLTFLLVYLAILCSIVFILLFGESPRLRYGPVGSAHRFLTDTLPQFIIKYGKRILGDRLLARFKGIYHYTCESRNPFLQIFFLFLLTGSIYLFFISGWKEVPGPFLSQFHVYFIPLEILFTYGCYYTACAADPGIITKENLQKYMDLYPYDGLIFEPRDCSTCKMPKPARSKHCSMCKGCVARSDHHCAWVNICIGHNNHRYFLLFLFALWQFLLYAVYVTFSIYRGKVVQWGLDAAVIKDALTGKQTPLSFRKAMLYVLQEDRLIGALGILSAVVSVIIFCFTLYQLYLSVRGLTTNEAFKWEMVQDGIYKGEIWKFEDKQVKNRRAKDHGTDFFWRDMDVDPKTGRISPMEGARMVKDFSEVPNMYDKGLLNNLTEVLFPDKVK
ncbi:DHHC palmitoyltransferase-domain-containing protein [Umbelopsis sp. PMI_123]|nr:DHHC palmitoyltransferase-domain-containing protein [Umbelopsis sp. PMI_123]